MLNTRFFMTVAVLAALFIGDTARAQTMEQNTSDLELANQAIAANPSDINAYVKQSNALNKLGRYAEAATSLAKQCSLQPDADSRELCLYELSDYKKLHNLP